MSNLPAVQVIALLPIQMKHNSFSLFEMGGIFFICRIAILMGSLTASRLLQRASVFSILMAGELVSAFATAFLFVFSESIHYLILPLLIFLRCFSVGIMNNTRNVWLKNNSSLVNSEQIVIYSAMVVQVSYFLGGLIYVFSNLDLQIFQAVLLADSLTSVFSALIIFSIRPLRVHIKRDEKPMQLRMLGETLYTLVAKKFFLLSSLSLLLAIAIGGTDILFIEFGENAFGENVGFGIANMIYSLSN